MGKTLEEIEQIPERHLVEYEKFYQEQPFGLWREDYRLASIVHILAMINRDPKKNAPELADFMPFWNKSNHNKTEEDDGSEEFLAKR